jgi:urease accessory protein
MHAHALTRLLRLSSPALPVGAYSYSQGLETAIGLGWLRGEGDIGRWVQDVLAFNLARLEGPVLCRLQRAWEQRDTALAIEWNARFLAARETAELYAETCQMGSSLRGLLRATGELDEQSLARLGQVQTPAFPTVFAFAAAQWAIPLPATLTGYLFAWAENQVGAAMKTMKLGHIGAQRILAGVSAALPALVESALACEDQGFSNFNPALAIASALHETQDGRLFRS